MAGSVPVLSGFYGRPLHQPQCRKPDVLHRDGRRKALRQRRYCFSEEFYAIANAEYYGITGDRKCLERARRAYQLVYDLNHGAPDPTGLGPKTIPETRKGRALADPMIF